MPLRKITQVAQATDAVVKDRWFNVAGEFIRPSQIARYDQDDTGTITFVILDGGTVTGQPTAIGDTSKILFEALRRVKFDGRSEVLPPLAPTDTTEFYLTSAMADGYGGDTVQSIVTEAGPDVTATTADDIVIVENTSGRWIQNEWASDSAADFPGQRYQTESVAVLVCLQTAHRSFDSSYIDGLTFGGGAVQLKGQNARLFWRTGSVVPNVHGTTETGLVNRLAFFRPAGEAVGKLYAYNEGASPAESTGTSNFGSQQTASDTVQEVDANRALRYNFFRLERGLSESYYDELLTEFKNSTPGPSA